MGDILLQPAQLAHLAGLTHAHALSLFWFVGDYHVDILNQILLYSIFALSLNLLLGYAGQASIAHAAFGAIGGYIAGYLSAKSGVSFVPSVLLAVGGSFIFGTIISVPALRLSGDYLILVTLAISTIVTSIIIAWSKLGGAYGLLGIKYINLFGKSFETPADRFWPVFVLSALTFLVCWRIGESPFGRVLKAIREDETATRSLGKNVVAYKVIIFGVTSAMAGLAGALFVYYNQLASPAEFSVNISIYIIAMVVFGGSANLIGSVLGAALLVVSGPFLEKQVSLGQEKAALWRLLIYGLALVVLMMVRPQGIMPERTTPKDWFKPLGRLSALLRRSTPAPAMAVATAATAGRDRRGVPFGGQDGDFEAQIRVSATAAAHVGEVSAELRHSIEEDTHAHEAVAAHVSASHVAVAPLAGEGGPPSALVVRGLKKHFGGIRAVDGVDLELPQREVTGLIGPNGAGKSTLFGLFTGFLKPDAGSVLLKGDNVIGKSPETVAKLGMVRSFQDVRMILGLTVVENVMLAYPHNPGENLGGLFFNPPAVTVAERVARTHALEYLEFVGLADKADWLAGGLAYAEQKLAAIARVLATGAEVLLLDEPTSGVDPRWVDSVAKVIRELPTLGKTVCIVEHNLSFLEKIGAPVYYMEAGVITRKGYMSDLMADAALRKAYFGV